MNQRGFLFTLLLITAVDALAQKQCDQVYKGTGTTNDASNFACKTR